MMYRNFVGDEHKTANRRDYARARVIPMQKALSFLLIKLARWKSSNALCHLLHRGQYCYIKCKLITRCHNFFR